MLLKFIFNFFFNYFDVSNYEVDPQKVLLYKSAHFYKTKLHLKFPHQNFDLRKHFENTWHSYLYDKYTF